MMSNSENTITTAFVSVLRPMRHAWSANSTVGRNLGVTLEKELAYFNDTVTPKESPHETWRNVR